MEISNEFKSRRIQMEKLEFVSGYPSFRILIKVCTENMQADFDEFTWISLVDLERFLRELTILEEKRVGEATLLSMSPLEEYSLRLKAIDVLGHIIVDMRFQKEDRTNRDYSFSLSVAFQIDPSMLPSIIRDVKEFACPM